jgi:hypothetical protein
MNIPSFTAEASLYKTSGYYQTGRRMLNLRRQMNGAIYPAMMKEDIEVHGCAPGSTLWEDGDDWGCNPIDFGGFGGGGGGGPVVVADRGGPRHGSGGSGSGGPGKPREKRSAQNLQGLTRCTIDQVMDAIKSHPDEVDACISSRAIGGFLPALYCGPLGQVACCSGDSEVSICDDPMSSQNANKK